MKTQTFREVVAAAILTLVVTVPALMVTVSAQSPAPHGGPLDLIGMLKATPGVLGVDAGSMMSGKQVIFAWFENRKALLGWYYSDQHMALMMQFGQRKHRAAAPLADVPDDGRPILAIASVTLTGPPPASGADLANVPQIAIELYTPLPGGLAAGGRFAPSSVHVPGMIEAPASGRPASAQ